MSKKLLIVESPTKAKTIAKILGKDYIVLSSFGHIRDLPKNQMGIDIEHDFKPKYIIPRKAAPKLKKIKENIKKVEEIILATDEDREGEAIAWHLLQVIKPQKTQKIKRIVFHEITPQAIHKALENPRGIDQNLVNAQQARRILDRLVGYELSPLLWKKIARGLSAGRVQSAALRMIIEREEERRKFKSQEYWSITAKLYKENKKNAFDAQLYKIRDRTLKKLDLKNQKETEKILKDLKKQKFIIEKINKKETYKNPLPPFTTSTLQQTASKQLHFSAKQTMMIAQQLYEGIDLKGKGSTGLITYMRTDSTNLSNIAIQNCREIISKLYGQKYLPEKPKQYKTKSKLAQEAHEAIRPTDFSLIPEKIKESLSDQQYKLYKLIWQRSVASQMKQAIISQTHIIIQAGQYQFKTTGQIIVFDGFLKVYPTSTKEKILPNLQKGDELKIKEIIPKQHFTEPPTRYSEATLIKALEEKGIGRPSTYAPIISTILDRGYVDKDSNKKLAPTEIGELVNKLLVENFPKIVDLNFTAEMEKKFDLIAQGNTTWLPIIRDFYFPFKEIIKEKEQTLNKKDFTEQETDLKCEKCGSNMIIKLGRYGKFYACSNFPKCKNTKPLEQDIENEQKNENDKNILIKQAEEPCEKCASPMILKSGPYGKFWACSNYPDCKNIKPFIKKIGIKCPYCKNGEIIERKTKKGKIFYGCNQYPKCKFISWAKPVDKKCPTCNKIMIPKNKEQIICIDKKCPQEPIPIT